MRKFYLLGSKNVKRSLVLMALAVGTAQGLQAQCTNSAAVTCTGGNVSQPFTGDDGDFTSTTFVYSSVNGNFSTTSVSGSPTYTITSPIYVANGGPNMLVGFSYTGTASLND